MVPLGIKSHLPLALVELDLNCEALGPPGGPCLDPPTSYPAPAGITRGFLNQVHNLFCPPNAPGRSDHRRGSGRQALLLRVAGSGSGADARPRPPGTDSICTAALIGERSGGFICHLCAHKTLPSDWRGTTDHWGEMSGRVPLPPRLFQSGVFILMVTTGGMWKCHGDGLPVYAYHLFRGAFAHSLRSGSVNNSVSSLCLQGRQWN